MASTDSAPSPVLSMDDPRLADVAALGDDAAALVSLLLREDQGHVLAAWRAGAPEQEAAKRAQLEQVRGLERGYPGGLAAGAQLRPEPARELSDPCPGRDRWRSF